MSEGKDPAIKLFGKTIPLPEIPADGGDGDGGGGCVLKSGDCSSSSSSSSEADSKRDGEECVSNDNNKDVPEEKSAGQEEGRLRSIMSGDVADASATTVLNDTHQAPSSENDSATAKPPKMAEEEQSETSNSQDKTLKKPDKILPCPRCNSMDTKFCYYNNYNVNQPRHFCKSCQRYWTAGGTIRNVPVGAGRRKNKTSASQFRQVTVTEEAALPNILHHPALKPNGTVLTFGSETPLCESMSSVLNIVDKKMNANELHKPEVLKIQVPSNDDANSSGSSVTEMPNCHGFSPPVPCFPHGPWPYPWSPQMGTPFPNPQMGPPFCPPAFPMPFYPAIPYWGCALPGPWVAPPYAAATPQSGPYSPTLGKHSREDEPSKENEPKKSLWVPKTLRIDDPDEAAKSSIWATLGIKNERSDSVNGGRMFKAFQTQVKEKENDPVLQANPAALSRSLNFQENS